MKILNSNVVLKIFDDEKRLGVFTRASKRLAALVGIKKRFAALLLLGLLAPCFSYCEIIPDSSAPANHRASISQTPNAPATQIDIASPNDKGVSINEYSKFNTPKEGTVFNNSQSGTISKTAGYIPPNPRLNRGEAKLIINQVNSSLPSNLQGNIEIAGKKADLIIANPNGINVNGATIINSKSSTLSTAKINYEEGRIKTFDVDKNGRINISDKGLNADGDYLNVISNSLKLEGKIYANEINVVVGDNEVKLKDSKEGLKGDNLQIVSKNLSSSPSVAIDSSALGGMYAGKINIISTKDGAGVNNKGAILANDSLRLNSKGELINEARIGSNGEVQIYSKAVHNRKGAKISAPSLNVQTMALNNGGEIEAGTLKIKTNRLDNIKGNISSSSALKIEAKSLINKDRAAIGTANSEISKELGLDKKGNLNAAGKISPQKSELSVISADHISNIGGAILSNESYLDIKDSLLNDNGIISLRSLDAEIADFSNTAGSSFEVRQGLRLRGKNLRNEGSIVSLGDISLSYDLINNSKGSIISGEGLSLNAKSLDNEEGLINSKKNLSLSLDSLIHMGKLNLGGDLYLA